MGWDTVIISKHDLNTKNVYDLACDLSKRLEINVNYGYQDQFNIDLASGEELHNYDFVTLGEVKDPLARENYILDERNYQIKGYYQKYGDDFIKRKDFKIPVYLKDEYKDLADKIYYELACRKEICKYNGFIQNDTFHYDYLSNRWGLFCNYFEDYGNNFKDLNEHRVELRELVIKFGGKDVLYIPDQGDSEDLSVDIYSWNDLIAEVKNRYADSIIYIADFVKNKRVRKGRVNPNAFYDDFSDL